MPLVSYVSVPVNGHCPAVRIPIADLPQFFTVGSLDSLALAMPPDVGKISLSK